MCCGYRGSSSDFYGPKKGLGSSNWGSSSGSGWDSKSSWADTKPSWDKSDSSALSSWDSKPSWDKAESKSSWDRDTSDRFDSKQSSSFAENISSSGKNYDDAKFVVFFLFSFPVQAEKLTLAVVLIQGYFLRVNFVLISRGRNRKNFDSASAAASDSVEAQKKFGNAKAISSSQFFGDQADVSWCSVEYIVRIVAQHL